MHLEDGEGHAGENRLAGRAHLRAAAPIDGLALAPPRRHIDPLHRADKVPARIGSAVMHEVHFEMPGLGQLPRDAGGRNLSRQPMGCRAALPSRQTVDILAQVFQHPFHCRDAHALQQRVLLLRYLQLAERGQMPRRLRQRGLQPLGADPVQTLGHAANDAADVRPILRSPFPRAMPAHRPGMSQQV